MTIEAIQPNENGRYIYDPAGPCHAVIDLDGEKAAFELTADNHISTIHPLTIVCGAEGVEDAITAVIND